MCRWSCCIEWCFLSTTFTQPSINSAQHRTGAGCNRSLTPFSSAQHSSHPALAHLSRFPRPPRCAMDSLPPILHSQRFRSVLFSCVLLLITGCTLGSVNSPDELGTSSARSIIPQMPQLSWTPSSWAPYTSSKQAGINSLRWKADHLGDVEEWQEASLKTWRACEFVALFPSGAAFILALDLRRRVSVALARDYGRTRWDSKGFGRQY